MFLDYNSSFVQPSRNSSTAECSRLLIYFPALEISLRIRDATDSNPTPVPWLVGIIYAQRCFSQRTVEVVSGSPSSRWPPHHFRLSHRGMGPGGKDTDKLSLAHLFCASQICWSLYSYRWRSLEKKFRFHWQDSKVYCKLKYSHHFFFCLSLWFIRGRV